MYDAFRKLKTLFRAAPALSELCEGRNNNLNLLRMILASAVLVSHTVPLCYGVTTDFSNSLGDFSVYGFFAISGFLVTQSLFRRHDVADFTTARVLRIFPGLFVVLALTVLLLGPVATALSLSAYMQNPATWTYILRNLTLFSLQWGLPGVFTNLPSPDAINGSLWTLFHEVLCYIGLGCVGLLGISRFPRFFLSLTLVYLLIVTAFALSHIPFPQRISDWLHLSPCFAVGIISFLGRRYVPISRVVAIFMTLFSVIIYLQTDFSLFLYVSFFYSLFTFGYARFWRLNLYNRLGDYSYGMYIYAFPVQQLVAWSIPGITPLSMALSAFPMTLIFAVLSWHFIEKPSLQLKRKIVSRKDKRYAVSSL